MMKVKVLIVFVGFLCGCDFVVRFKDDEISKGALPYKKGFNFTSWRRTEYALPYAKSSFDSMLTSGANWISIVVTLYQRSAKDTIMVEDLQKTPSVYSISQIVQYAHRNNFKVMLKIHVDIYDGTSRTEVDPMDISVWFRNYTRYVLNYATLADMLNIEMFCIGTELAMLSSKRELWSRLIDSVRSIYSGKVIYASNFDEYRRVSFWDKLDYIGVDFYAPISNKKDPTYDELVLGWQPYLNDLKKWFDENRWCKKLIFTEIGYPSTDGASMEPWKIGEVVDLEEQNLCYEVALSIISNLDFVDGVFFWNWEADLSLDSLKMGFSPYGKPALGTIKRYWRNLEKQILKQKQNSVIEDD